MGGSWSVTLEPKDLNVHRQFGIELKIPSYKNHEIEHDVRINIGRIHEFFFLKKP